MLLLEIFEDEEAAIQRANEILKTEDISNKLKRAIERYIAALRVSIPEDSKKAILELLKTEIEKAEQEISLNQRVRPPLNYNQLQNIARRIRLVPGVSICSLWMEKLPDHLTGQEIPYISIKLININKRNEKCPGFGGELIFDRYRHLKRSGKSLYTNEMAEKYHTEADTINRIKQAIGPEGEFKTNVVPLKGGGKGNPL